MAEEPRTLDDDMRAQHAFLRVRVPVYASLLELLRAELDHGLEARLDEVWREREFPAFYERPLLLLGALRDDALREGEAHPLWRAIASPAPDLNAVSEAAVADALAPERTHLWRALAVRHLQTNEPSRAVAWLWPARLAADAMPARPVVLFDVGASAGLNLIADRLSTTWQRDDGSALNVAPRQPVVARAGFDLRPLDVRDDEDARWVRACVWPGQTDREARLLDAISAFRESQGEPDAPVLHAARAADVPDLLPAFDGGSIALVYQTIVRDYVPSDEWEEYAAGLCDWLESRPAGTAIWVELEVTQQARTGGPPAAITVHIRAADGLRSWLLAYCEPHPRRLAVNDAAVSELLGALRAAA